MKYVPGIFVGIGVFLIMVGSMAFAAQPSAKLIELVDAGLAWYECDRAETMKEMRWCLGAAMQDMIDGMDKMQANGEIASYDPWASIIVDGDDPRPGVTTNKYLITIGIKVQETSDPTTSYSHEVSRTWTPKS